MTLRKQIMTATGSRRADVPYLLSRALIALAGAGYLLTGLALLFAPRWFYENIGTFPPFNRHYAGDLGSFLLPLGAGLLFAAREPARHALLVRVAAAASLIHAVNHLYDTLTGDWPLSHWLADTLPLLLLALLLLLAQSGRLGRRPGA